MEELLPLSWTRIEGIKAVYRDILLPVSRIHWVTFADIPHDFSFQILYEDLCRTYPDGYLIRGCTPMMAAFFHREKCHLVRSGAEAVLDLCKPHMNRKTVTASLNRGNKHGHVEEITVNDLTIRRFEAFRSKTTHADKPQLSHVFRQHLSLDNRIFVFRSYSGKWLAVITISRRARFAFHTELMLRHCNAPGDIMECLVAGIFDVLKNEGIQEWSLGEVPFVYPDQATSEPLNPVEKLIKNLASSSKYAYDYETLYRFKNKFTLVWRPVMLCTFNPPTTVLLAELAFAMGFTNLLAYESMMIVKKLLNLR
jgi:glycosyltransferase 2 family protein